MANSRFGIKVKYLNTVNIIESDILSIRCSELTNKCRAVTSIMTGCVLSIMWPLYEIDGSLTGFSYSIRRCSRTTLILYMDECKDDMFSGYPSELTWPLLKGYVSCLFVINMRHCIFHLKVIRDFNILYHSTRLKPAYVFWQSLMCFLSIRGRHQNTPGAATLSLSLAGFR